VVADLVGLARGFLELRGHARRAVRVRSGQQQDELVAPEPRDGVAVAHHGPQALGDLDEQGIAHAVAERIVDVLEVVQIQEHHGQGRAVLLGHADRMLGAFGQQGPVRQPGERIVVGQPVDALLVVLAVVDLAVQALDGFAQLPGAFPDLVLQLGMHAREFGLRLALFAHVQGDADGAQAGVQRIECAAAHFADHRASVLRTQFDLTGEAGRILLDTGAAMAAFHRRPVLVAEMPVAGGAFGQLAGCIAQHLLEMAVAAGQPVAAHERDAHHGMVEQGLLLPHGGLQSDLCVPLLVDVVDDPDGALGRVGRVDETPRETGPEQPAILSLHLALAAVGQPAGERGIGCTAQGAECRSARVQALAAQADRLVRGGVAEYLGVAGIAAHHLPLPDENDAHARAVQQCLLLPEKALHRRAAGGCHDRHGPDVGRRHGRGWRVACASEPAGRQSVAAALGSGGRAYHECGPGRCGPKRRADDLVVMNPPWPRHGHVMPRCDIVQRGGVPPRPPTVQRSIGSNS